MPYTEISDGSSEFIETKVNADIIRKKYLASAGLGTLQIPRLKLAMQLKLILKSEEHGVWGLWFAGMVH